ncbi:triose-phosphate isomerase family protein [Microbacterium sp.]|uniref:triose-phosphate isomerase family protein n=1 Tax=Microbacterium sp. TaxID=51671 RepID=UPI003A8B42E1
MTDTEGVWSAPWLIGVSHKTYFTSARAREWTEAVARIAAGHLAVRSGEVTLFAVPGLLDTAATAATLAGPVQVGVQDVSEHPPGAWTGEVPAEAAAEVGCTLAEIGHAERRRWFGETDEVVAQKTARALAAGLTPLVCVGETQQGEPETAVEETRRQIDAALVRARTDGRDVPVVFAYEPVWAIGAPEPAGDDHIRVVAGALRDYVHALPGFAGSRLIYGGAAGPGLLSRVGDSVDGLFLGRFAHDPAALAAIVDEASALLAARRGRSTP